MTWWVDRIGERMSQRSGRGARRVTDDDVAKANLPEFLVAIPQRVIGWIEVHCLHDLNSKSSSCRALTASEIDDALHSAASCLSDFGKSNCPGFPIDICCVTSLRPSLALHVPSRFCVFVAPPSIVFVRGRGEGAYECFDGCERHIKFLAVRLPQELLQRFIFAHGFCPNCSIRRHAIRASPHRVSKASLTTNQPASGPPVP